MQGDEMFRLEEFENAVYSRKHELAGKLLLRLLLLIDQNYGEFPREIVFKNNSHQTGIEQVIDHFFGRLAAAVTSLFADPDFQLSEGGFYQFMTCQRWLGIVFSRTAMKNADHVIYSLNNLGWDSPTIQWNARDILKMALIMLPDSGVPIDMNMVWKSSHLLAINIALAWVTPRFLGTVTAHNRRDFALTWLPEHLKKLQMEELLQLPLNKLHDVYMHCSYSSRKNKHDIKKAIHRSCHKLLDHYGFKDISGMTCGTIPLVDGKPVMVVLLEWFNAQHSVFRTHSRSLLAMRSKFHMIGIGLGDDKCVDKSGREIFHEFISFESGAVLDQLKMVRDVIEQRGARVLYMPSVGMQLITIFASSMRMAPVQFTALGHGASTQSPWVDYFAVDEDYIGEKTTFSEQVIALPVDAMPFINSSSLDLSEIKPLSHAWKGKVKIAVAATVMKLNPEFLRACRQITERAKTKIEFNFFVGGCTGLVWPLVQQFISGYLPDNSIIYRHLPYPEYMRKLSQCEMFITPFPYGNMNGIADAAICGLAGVCKSGPHVHEHIDPGLFERLGYPKWTIAKSVGKYIDATVRMADNHEERLNIQKQLLSSDNLGKLYQGRPEILGEEILKILTKTCTGE
jgi:hypothetical protein